jgi:ribulose-5-phosphate 4-epimerase/fuculose-1-phosphate aldolase
MGKSSVRSITAGHPSWSEAERISRTELAAAYRIAAHYGWGDLTSTHISVRLPGPEHHFLINSLHQMFEEITASSLLKIDMQGNLVEPSDGIVNKAGFVIHSAVHAAREDAKCVFHFHTVSGIAVGAQRLGLLPVSAHALFLCGRVGYHDYEGVVDDEGEQPRIVRDLGSNAALFLRNHGTLAVGATVAEGFYNSYMLERACQIQLAALSNGPDVVLQNQASADHMQAQMGKTFGRIFDISWDALVRLMDRKDPSYRN